MNLATGVAYVDGRARVGRRARTDDVHRPAAGEGKGGGKARGLQRLAMPQSSVVRLWLLIIVVVK